MVLRILLKSPEVLATEIFDWAVENELIDTVSTIYEIYAGDEQEGGMMW